MSKKPDPSSAGELPPDPYFPWQRYIPTALVLFAFLVRVLYLFSMRNHPWVALPVVDEIDYNSLARIISRSHFSAILPTFRPPLWPLVLSGVYSLFGEHFVLARLVNAAIGALAVGSLYRLSTRLFSEKTSRIAAIIASLMGVAIHLETSGLATSLLLLLLFESIIAAIDTYRSPNLIKGILTGLLFGLAVLARPVAVVPAVIFLVGCILQVVHRGSATWRKAVPASVLTFILVLAPVAVLNHGQGGEIIASNTGINFFLGNHTGADGIAPVHPVFGPGWTPEQVNNWAEQESGRKLNAAETSSWYMKRTFDDWKHAPAKALLLFSKKLLLTFSGEDISNNGDIHYLEKTRPFLMITGLIGTWWMLPLGLMGAIASWKQSSVHRLVVLSALTILLATALIFVTTRFRLPAILLLTPFAVDFVRSLVKLPRHSPRTIGVFIALFAFVLLLNLPVRSIAPKSNRAYGLLLDGQLHARAGMGQQAIHYFNSALEETPTTPLANQSIGFLLLEMGNLDSAELAFQRELNLHQNSDSYRGLALIERNRGDHRKAAAFFARASQLQPWNNTLRRSQAEELGALGAQLLEVGKLDSAWTILRDAERIDSSNPFFTFGQACISYLQGDSLTAEFTMDSLRKEHPGYPAVKDWFDNGWRP